MPGSVTGSTRMDEIEQKYDVVMNFPNLELHSAAAEGNVGLVHYALTHGQPVNSVLHGVQPIHAAAAGGSVSALKMLIDRGADVNAPRLPRRYSNEKKRGVPSLGAAGATPLHFAAANGHAPIVQLLLTCGALPDKSDKLGQTPETLAEANGHEDVLHVLKVYDHLKRQDSAVETISLASGSAAYSGQGSPGPSVIQLEEDVRPSRKGKERAMSIASNRSDASGILKLRKSLDGLLGRRSRRNSVSTESEDIPPVPPLPASPPRIDIQEPDIPDPDNDTLRQAGTASRPSSPDGLPFPPSGNSSVYHSIQSSPLSAHAELPSDIDPPLPELARIPSSESQASASTFASLRSGPHLTLPREHRKSHSSRRPSLPSILEKAAHPGQAFRNALHHRREQDQVRFSSDADSPRSVSGNSFFGRGRRTTTENLSSGSSGGSQTLSGAQDKARKYMSRHAFIGLFRRSNSPPSRSPSPPRRSDRSPIDAQELEEGMERFKRASIELDRQERRSLDESREREVIPRSPPNSAPPIKTRFFEDLGPTPLNIPNSFFISPRAEGRKSPISPPSADRPWNRPRKGSGVIAPSPLANEWARESSDSDSTAPAGIRRTRTEGGREHGPSRLSESTPPGSLRANKQRSATLPSSPAIPMSGLGRNATVPRLVDLALDDRMDLRSGVLRRESEKKREEIGAEEEDEEEVFHDAQADVEEVMADGQSTPVLHPSEDLSERIEKEASTSPVTSSIRNRYRGASIGSMNSQSSRLSALSRLNPSDDSNSDKYRYRGFDKLPHPNPPSISGDTRPRGKSVSSIATTASGSGLGFSSYNHSTSATSLTPPSTLSITLGSAFPPVPEDDVANHPSSVPPVPQRKFSTRAEAAKVIKQQEDDMLQLAQLPLNATSTRDLAAQLAAYGENHVIEQELAQIERRERKYARRTGRSKFEIQDDTGSSKSSSFVSAQSVHSGVESGVSGATSSRRSESVGSSRLRPDTAPYLVSVEAPKSSVPNISSIYDRRATLYREKMQALTSTPALHPPPRSKSGVRQRSVTENLPTGPPAWLTGSQSPAQHRNGREISASLPVGSLPVQPPGQGIMAGASTPKPPRNRKESFHSVRPPSSMSAPPPIADIINTRYQGLAGPSSLRPSTTLYAPSSRAASRTAQSITGSITPAPAPPVSIFSHRYAGPHDGGESDDSEGEHKGYTMVENNWRGKMVQADGTEALKKGKWGFKGPFGKKK